MNPRQTNLFRFNVIKNEELLRRDSEQNRTENNNEDHYSIIMISGRGELANYLRSINLAQEEIKKEELDKWVAKYKNDLIEVVNTLSFLRNEFTKTTEKNLSNLINDIAKQCDRGLVSDKQVKTIKELIDKVEQKKIVTLLSDAIILKLIDSSSLKISLTEIVRAYQVLAILQHVKYDKEQKLDKKTLRNFLTKTPVIPYGISKYRSKKISDKKDEPQIKKREEEPLSYQMIMQTIQFLNELPIDAFSFEEEENVTDIEVDNYDEETIRLKNLERLQLKSLLLVHGKNQKNMVGYMSWMHHILHIKAKI